MKLWHDDVRPAPEGWVWAKTNQEAVYTIMIAERAGDPCTEISMDHDLGGESRVTGTEDDYYIAGSSPNGDGKDLVRAMVALRLVPKKVIIHSWNAAGAAEMARILADHGYPSSIKPFSL